MNLEWLYKLSSHLSCRWYRCIFLKVDINGLPIVFLSFLSVWEQGQDRDRDGVCQQGRAVWLHQRAPAPERARDATLLQTDSLRRAPLPQSEKTQTVLKKCAHSFFFLNLSLPRSHTPRLCFPGVLIVTLTMPLLSQPYSQSICRPCTVCFSWRAGVRESSGSEWRWNTGQFNSGLIQLRYCAPIRPCISSVLICWHTGWMSRDSPKAVPQRFSSHTHVNRCSTPH